MMQNALMTYECDKLQQAMLLLKDMERECAGDIGWLKSMKSRVFKEEETSVSVRTQRATASVISIRPSSIISN